MKKIVTLLSVIAITTVTLISCSKKGDYTCTCTIMGQTGQAAKFPNVKKSDAETSCQSLEDQANATVPGSTDCTLTED